MNKIPNQVQGYVVSLNLSMHTEEAVRSLLLGLYLSQTFTENPLLKQLTEQCEKVYTRQYGAVNLRILKAISESYAGPDDAENYAGVKATVPITDDVLNTDEAAFEERIDFLRMTAKKPEAINDEYSNTY